MTDTPPPASYAIDDDWLALPAYREGPDRQAEVYGIRISRVNVHCADCEDCPSSVVIPFDADPDSASVADFAAWLLAAAHHIRTEGTDR